MTFLRRHWPDLIISLLIVALLIGFGLVLLGGNRKPVTNAGSQTPTPPANSQTNTPTPPASTDTTTQVAPTPTPAVPEPNPTPAPTADIPQAPSDVPTIPAQPEPNPSATQAPTPAPTTADSTATTGASEATTGASTQAASAAGNPVPTTSADVPTRRNYRVSVGTYTSEAVAQERTAVISQLGYTVHLIPVDQGVVAQIGPFADAATGQRALADIQRVFSGAVLRAPIGQPAPQDTSSTSTGASTPTPPATPNQSSTTGSTDDTNATPQPTEPAPPTNTPVYLQVGAFDQQDRAQTLVQQLRDLGYVPSIIAPPGRKVRVLVGPYTGDALTRTETRLSQNGIDHFRVR